jgi:hypothetical protein
MGDHSAIDRAQRIDVKPARLAKQPLRQQFQPGGGVRDHRSAGVVRAPRLAGRAALRSRVNIIGQDCDSRPVNASRSAERRGRLDLASWSRVSWAPTQEVFAHG